MDTAMKNMNDRLLVLYALNSATFPMTRLDLSLLMMDTLLMNYFSYNETLTALLEGSYIIEDTVGNKDYLEITQEGRSTLDLLDKDIEESKKEIIREYLRRRKMNIMENNSIEAYIRNEDLDSRIVTLVASENKKRILEINVEVSDDRIAREIMENWKQNSHSIFPGILELLLKPVNDDEEVRYDRVEDNVRETEDIRVIKVIKDNKDTKGGRKRR